MNPNRQFAKSIREFMEERQSLERGETVVNERKMNFAPLARQMSRRMDSGLKISKSELKRKVSKLKNRHSGETFDFNEIVEFISYVNKFYNKDMDDALYPIATESEIIDAVIEHLTNHKGDIAMDSTDREFVRKILQPSYRMV